MAGAPKKPVYYVIRDSLIAFHFQVLRKGPVGTPDPEGAYGYLRPRILTFPRRRFGMFCRDPTVSMLE